MLNFMEEDRVRILDLEAQIRVLERSISTLRAEQELTQNRLDAYKYPILTLPHEITSKIFTHFLPMYPAAPASLTSLTHVCRHWRDVALANPALWCTMMIEVDVKTTPYARAQIRAMSDAWIGRSGSRPLSIHINSANPAFLHELFTEPSTMDSARWAHLTLDAPLSALPKTGCPLPALRSLDFTSLAFTIIGEAFTFYEAPQLHIAVLSGRVIPRVTLPWTQLLCLTLHNVDLYHSIRILRQTPNLMRCTITLSDNVIPELELGSRLAQEADVVLPCVESLILYDDSWFQALAESRVLDLFVVPSLARLELDAGFLGEAPISALESFLSKAGCSSLQEVCIRGQSTINDGNGICQAFPAIRRFSFPDSSSDEAER
ncbi:F-box domain-containing protein [Mycena sanguinolenta]|uniref:F-box domain-containing protein n=1 Tax=Mycena sanguinolenta TaxID=230812 RepID=A0A8H7DKM5_9AGAR|nr:F-box domain-containing protein [Mycena sanguinolenta]